MDVLNLVGLERVGLADSRKERFFRDASQEAEHHVGGLDRVFALGPAVLQEERDLGSEALDQPVDPLELRPGRPEEKPLPVGGELRLLVPFEAPGMHGHALPLDEDLDRIGQSQDLSSHARVGRWDRVAVGVELHERRLGHRGPEPAVGPGLDPGQRPELLVPEHLGGRALGRPVDALIAVVLPGENLGVELRETRDRGDAEEGLQVSDHSFDPAFFVGPGHVAGLDRKPVVAGKVQEGRVVLRLRIAPQDDAPQVVVAMAVGATPPIS